MIKLNITNARVFWIEFIRNSNLVLAVILMLSAIGCTTDDTNSSEDILGEFNTKSIQHEGVERTYRVYLPKNFDKNNPTPMVIALHGGGGSGKRFEKDVSAGTLTTAAESRGVLLVTPEGIDKRWNDGRPVIFNGDTMYDDVGFISAIIDNMTQNYGVDSKSVYVTGISNGGFMSVRLGLELSNKITAIAPVTAQITEAIASTVPEFPISVMIINGVDDPFVPYTGGPITIFNSNSNRGNTLSTEESIQRFNTYNQCTNPVENEPIIDDVPNDGTSIEISKYTGCNQGTEVVLIKVVGGGHTWPNGAQYLPMGIVGRVSREINASEMILDFFLRHSKN
ncbi:alpha/beta hydrolase-fold protein [Maribacter sp.]|nr:alpha/beta hydrolase-fold protein [Maribacter sp.]